MTRNEAAGIVWGLGDTKRSCWDRLGVGCHETKLLASSGAWVMQDEAACFVWGLGDTK